LKKKLALRLKLIIMYAINLGTSVYGPVSFSK